MNAACRAPRTRPTAGTDAPGKGGRSHAAPSPPWSPPGSTRISRPRIELRQNRKAPQSPSPPSCQSASSAPNARFREPKTRAKRQRLANTDILDQPVFRWNHLNTGKLIYFKDLEHLTRAHSGRRMLQRFTTQRRMHVGRSLAPGRAVIQPRPGQRGGTVPARHRHPIDKCQSPLVFV